MELDSIHTRRSTSDSTPLKTSTLRSGSWKIIPNSSAGGHSQREATACWDLPSGEEEEGFRRSNVCSFWPQHKKNCVWVMNLIKILPYWNVKKRKIATRRSEILGYMMRKCWQKKKRKIWEFIFIVFLKVVHCVGLLSRVWPYSHVKSAGIIHSPPAPPPRDKAVDDGSVHDSQRGSVWESNHSHTHASACVRMSRRGRAFLSVNALTACRGTRLHNSTDWSGECPTLWGWWTWTGVSGRGQREEEQRGGKLIS